MAKTTYHTSRLQFIVMVLVAFGSVNLTAQGIRIGVMPVANLSLYQHGRSHYNHDEFRSSTVAGGGFWIPLRINVNPNFSFLTGAGWQMKTYKFIQDFEAPGITGHSRMSTRFSCFEVPVIATYSSGENSLRLEYQAGLVLTYNMPNTNSMGHSAEFTGPGGISVWSPEPSWEKTFSPDLYAGLSLVRFKADKHPIQLTLAFQYGLIPTSRFDLYTDVDTETTDKYYLNFLRPALSTVSLSFTFWPGFLNFPAKQKAEDKKAT